MDALQEADYDVVPVYINRRGRWFSGEPLFDLKVYTDEVESIKGVVPVVLSPAVQHHGLILHPMAGRFARSEVQRLDVVFPAVHGTHGEDGTLQGLLELADIPYAGCMTLGSALANDKIVCKAVLRQHDIPVVDGLDFTRVEWLDAPETVMQRIKEALPYPVFVKPATTGSSIGIGKADNDALLRASIDVASHFDRRFLVETAISGHVEINCAVLGNAANIRASTLEQPLSWDQFLTYDDKYMRGSEGMKSADRIIPAPLSPDLTARIQDMAVRGFKAIDGHGTARIDFLVKPEEDLVYLNEVNTMPGSLAFYLWQAGGMSMRELVHEMVELAGEAQAEKRRSSYDYRSDLINLTQMRGLKGVKGAKSGKPQTSPEG
jgi:D-alanine-D-alanine ligase